MFVLSIYLSLNQCSVATIVFGKQIQLGWWIRKVTTLHSLGALNPCNSLIQLSSLYYAVMFR